LNEVPSWMVLGFWDPSNRY